MIKVIRKTRARIPPQITQIIPLTGFPLHILSSHFEVSIQTLQSLTCISSSPSRFTSSLLLVAECRIPIDIFSNRGKVKMFVGIARNVYTSPGHLAYENKSCGTPGQTSRRPRYFLEKNGTNGIPQNIPTSARQRNVSTLSEEIQAERGTNHEPVAVT